MQRALGPAECVPRLPHLLTGRHPRCPPAWRARPTQDPMLSLSQLQSGPLQVSAGQGSRAWGPPAGIKACRALWGRNGSGQRMWKRRKGGWTSCGSLEGSGWPGGKGQFGRKPAQGRALPKPRCGLSPGDRARQGPAPEKGRATGPGTRPPTAPGPAGSSKGQLCWTQLCLLK